LIAYAEELRNLNGTPEFAAALIAATLADPVPKVTTVPVADLPETGAVFPHGTIEHFTPRVHSATGEHLDKLVEISTFPNALIADDPQLPNVPAPSTVGAPPPPTAPEVMTDTSLDPETAFGQPVPTPVPEAPTAVVPTVPPAPPVIVPIPPKFDSAGFPWDQRIHAGSAVLTDTGLWRKKRGVSDMLVREVEFELRQLLLLPPPPVQPEVKWPFSPGFVPPAPPPPPVQTDPIVPFVPAPPVPSTPPAPSEVSPPLAASPSNPTPTTFPEFMRRVTTMRIPQETVKAALSKHGIPSVPALASRLDYLPTIAAELGL
jgi:hypothetical protein